MKRIAILLSSGFVLIALIVLVASSPTASPKVPRFVPTRSQPIGSYVRMDYDWAGAVPFQGGKVWIWAIVSATNRHCFLYDLNDRMVVGELLNAGPVFFNHDQTTLLC